ncbi:hypothetical protein CK203_033179 [Vitis vinifera]|uniref:Uncharacterized protein n=1 Tax=Vitis vinifera TaxID=29760 RepID=A0A438G053_VITVI|nr:hypothetical protein CK203_033179 [Vitis vinifera]
MGDISSQHNDSGQKLALVDVWGGDEGGVGQPFLEELKEGLEACSYSFGVVHLERVNRRCFERNKGQFSSSKKSEGTFSWDSVQDSGQDESPPETL